MIFDDNFFTRFFFASSSVARRAQRRHTVKIPSPESIPLFILFYFFPFAVTLNLKKTTSPSFTKYVLALLAVLALRLDLVLACRAPSASSKAITSAQMKPRSKSVWIVPPPPAAP